MDLEDNEKAIMDSLKVYRKISRVPYKILDAPGLVDDFYLSVVDWSDKNHLAVSLLQSVWLWSGDTGNVLKFCEKKDPGSEYTSIKWAPKGELLAVGDNDGKLELLDFETKKKIREFEGHLDRIDCISWNGTNMISTGGRDHMIYTRDLRSPENYIIRFEGHRDEVCGLKWSPNGQQLASGGNDNRVFIWSMKKEEPETKLSQHTSAVKAIAWSPHQQGLLLTGGGYTDRTIKVWNTLSFNLIDCVETESQVCNMLFSKNSNEIVSTHGHYGNQIIVWKYPDLLKLSVIDSNQGHTERVLYLADSPDGENIVTGASDETLKFWNLFPARQKKNNSYLFPSFSDLR
jgi:cell division cycle 20-like protein 1 (cofactor of APC complex)